MAEEQTASAIPDWLRTVPRWGFTVPGLLLEPRLIHDDEGDWVRLADVVAAWRRRKEEVPPDRRPLSGRVVSEQADETQYWDALHAEREVTAKILARAEAAEAEREALRDLAYVSEHATWKERCLNVEAVHQTAQTCAQSLEEKLAALQAERDGLHAQVELQRALNQNYSDAAIEFNDAIIAAEKTCGLIGQGSYVDRIKRIAECQPDLTALRAAVAPELLAEVERINAGGPRDGFVPAMLWQTFLKLQAILDAARARVEPSA